MTGLSVSAGWLRSHARAARVEFDGPAWVWPDAVCVKHPYPSAHAARVAHRRAGFRVRTYWCETCQAVHVANAEKR